LPSVIFHLSRLIFRPDILVNSKYYCWKSTEALIREDLK
jgi:hypothetical protein